MNVRIVPRGHPERTLLFGGAIAPIVSDGARLTFEVDNVVFSLAFREVVIPLRDVAEILLDEDPGGGF